MSYIAARHTAMAQSPLEPTFQIDGQVVTVLRGSGIATLLTNSADDLTLSRSTAGVHFEQLRVGDWIHCKVGVNSGRVVHALKQIRPIPVTSADRSGTPCPKRPASTMAKEEFIAQYCRRRGVEWADIAQYRVALPSDDATGWTMVNTGCHDDEQTVQSPLE